MSEVSNQSMQQAVQAKVEGPFRASFAEIENLPESLKALDNISENFYWSWQPEGTALFRELDPDLWIKHEQNPRVLLKNVRPLRLWQKAGDEDYVAKINAFAAKLEDYVSTKAASSPSIA